MGSRRRRSLLAWCVPVGIIALVAAVGVVVRLLPAGADSAPTLPPLSNGQLLAKAQGATVPPLSGEVRLNTNIGLPDLSSASSFVGGTSATALDLLNGSHTARVWMDGPSRLRVALDAPLAESDWVVNGADAWAWQSSTQSVIHATLTGAGTGSGSAGTNAPADPNAFAQQLLANVGTDTDVAQAGTGRVAGRAVYRLVLTPRTPASTIGQAVISVDVTTGMALETDIFARGATSPAIEFGFASLSEARPDPSVFAFAPPQGAIVREAASPAGLFDLGTRGARHHTPTNDLPVGPTPLGTVIGQRWGSVAVISGLPIGRQLFPILRNAPRIDGPNASGRLIRTSLINVLVLDNGRLIVGAVTPDALQAAAADPAAA